MKRIIFFLLLFIFLLASACGGGGQTTSLPATATAPSPVTPAPTFPPASPTVPAATTTPTYIVPQGEPPAADVSPVESSTALPQPAPTLGPVAWESLPVVPMVGDRPRQIYQHGLELGNNPQAFSKIGDCGSTPAWFLGDFDRGPKYYRLGQYQDLEAVVQEFQGSFDRTSLAAKAGYNASSVFTPLWADRSQCQSNETPLACEYRVHRPAMAFIMLGTNDVHHAETFEPQMRQIIQFSIDSGVIPILTTKADNLEGDGSINATIARLALEYDVPLWNYWLAVQDLPDQGLQDDNAHITWGPNRFDDPQVMSKGWPVRNLTALQVLDAVWHSVTTSE